jgi:hypothetical protein
MYIPGPALMLDSPLDRGVPVPLRDSDAEGDPLL